MRLRPLLFQLHLWVGLAVAAVWTVATGTGAVLAFQHEVDAWLLRDQPVAVTPGDVGWERVAAELRARHPDERLALLWFPRWNNPTYEALLERGEESRTVQVDPGTGREIPPVAIQSRLSEVAAELHTSLLAGERGAWVVRVTTALSLALLLSGLFLWWPGVRRLARGFRVRTGRTGYILNFDLHGVAGALAFVPLLAMCVTGVFMAWPQVANRVVHAAFLRPASDLEAWDRVASAPPPAGWTEADRPRHAELLRRAHAEVPGARTFYVTWPDTPDEPVHVRLQTGIEPRPWGITSRLAFDQYTGRLIQVIDPRRMTAPEAVVQHWNDRLHFGDFAGAWSKALYLLACLAGTILAPTGVAMWWLRRRAQARGRIRRTERPGPAPARALEAMAGERTEAR
jgi:uncharacterized iron-regulated membrane protein